MATLRIADDVSVWGRLGIVVFTAVPLAALDLLLKDVLPADPMLFHRRSTDWIILCCVLLVVALVLARLPSRLVAVAAGLLAAGVLGNLLSARWHNGVVPNPFVVGPPNKELAFNLADVFVLAGIVLETVASLRLAIRYRHLLPESTIAVRLVRRLRARLAD
jgi:hypothetical protein